MRAVIKISKASAVAALPRQKRYFVWDMALPGFGLSVAPSGLKTFVLRYRAHYRYAQKRFITRGRLGPLTPDEARRRAKTILGQVADGGDPAADAMQEKFAAITLADACDRFIELHVRAKRKPNTIALYTYAIEGKIKPIFGHRNMVKIGKLEVVQFHSSMKDIPVMANRTIAALAALYSWAGKSGLIDEGFNPADLSPHLKRWKIAILHHRQLKKNPDSGNKVRSAGPGAAQPKPTIAQDIRAPFFEFHLNPTDSQKRKRPGISARPFLFARTPA